MAFGFGFNKAKVLAAAEKYVQQGKLNNAISEYEKIAAKDTKDLTVLNTIGDLYARIGQNEKAGEYFKRVGDTYSSEGFTVKAIAMYKKLTKLTPGATPVIQRLAELYTQQGLYNDARHQYLQLADASIKGNDLDGAIRIFQKLLEIDPDNVSLQSKLADLYIKIGKKEDAREIFRKAAQSLYDRGAIEQADQSLDRMLSLDPLNKEALFLRGKIALETGKGSAAATYFEKVPDIDSRADGLQLFLRAQILANNTDAAQGFARKLASVHNDLSGVRTYTEFLLTSGKSEAALNVLDEFVDRLIVGDTGELNRALQGLTGHLKENPDSLEKLRSVCQRAGANANIPEINELLAHAYVKAGELAKARDLYKELADLEASNPQHMQNYRQVLSRMGEEPVARPLAPSEGAQALFVEEIINAPAPPSQQEYPPALLEKINNALTDAELFESYNKPQQAVPPLEELLVKAPDDVRINQRLISVYSRIGQFAGAAQRCDVLQAVYEQAGMPVEAQKYQDMANRFRQRAGIQAVPKPASAPTTASVQPLVVAEAAPAPAEELPTFEVAPAEPPTAVESGEAHEIDLSSEWEAAVADTVAIESPSEQPAGTADVQPSVIADLIEEIRFYLSQGMLDEARSAITRCEQFAPASFELAELKQKFESAVSGAPTATPYEADTVEVEVDIPSEETPAEEATVVEFNFENETAEAVTPSLAEAEVKTVAPPADSAEEVAKVESEISLDEPVQEEMEVPVPAFEQTPVKPVPVPKVVAVEPEVTQQPDWAAGEPEEELELESSPDPAAASIAAESAPTEKDVFKDFVLDLEDALPADFGAPSVQPKKVAAAAAVSSTAAPASGASQLAVPQFAAAETQTAVAAETSDVNTSTVLSDLFAEFKEEVGESSDDGEDPETHYNLGVAFKEMGLLDEAIGELQKVCKSIERGTSFSQVMQAYTWLAGCFVEKGVPEASVKWYTKALALSKEEETRTAIHYDLASAFEAAGDRQQALKHFMEVYGTNIDYRDVAERIKALKS